MWVVRAGDDLYVRSVNGRDSSWFRGALSRHEGASASAALRRTLRSSRAMRKMTGGL
jgi:hypothetical protein